MTDQCQHDPRQHGYTNGFHNGMMYQCPDCGEMVIAGMEHPDYENISDATFSLEIKIGDKIFGGSITIQDWHMAPSSEVAEQALRRAMKNIYEKAIKDAVEEACYGEVRDSEQETE